MSPSGSSGSLLRIAPHCHNRHLRPLQLGLTVDRTRLKFLSPEPPAPISNVFPKRLNPIALGEAGMRFWEDWCSWTIRTSCEKVFLWPVSSGVDLQISRSNTWQASPLRRDAFWAQALISSCLFFASIHNWPRYRNPRPLRLGLP